MDSRFPQELEIKKKKTVKPTARMYHMVWASGKDQRYYEDIRARCEMPNERILSSGHKAASLIRRGKCHRRMLPPIHSFSTRMPFPVAHCESARKTGRGKVADSNTFFLLCCDESAGCRIGGAYRRGYSQAPIRPDVHRSRRVSIIPTARRPAAPATEKSTP